MPSDVSIVRDTLSINAVKAEWKTLQESKTFLSGWVGAPYQKVAAETKPVVRPKWIRLPKNAGSMMVEILRAVSTGTIRCMFADGFKGYVKKVRHTVARVKDAEEEEGEEEEEEEGEDTPMVVPKKGRAIKRGGTIKEVEEEQDEEEQEGEEMERTKAPPAPPKKARQTKRGGKKGRTFNAAVNSLAELQAENVPSASTGARRTRSTTRQPSPIPLKEKKKPKKSAWIGQPLRSLATSKSRQASRVPSETEEDESKHCFS